MINHPVIAQSEFKLRKEKIQQLMNKYELIFYFFTVMIEQSLVPITQGG